MPRPPGGGGCCLAGGQGDGTRDATSYLLGFACYSQAALMTRIIVFSESSLVNGPNPGFDNLIIILISCFGKIKISCGKRANANFCCISDIVASILGGIVGIRSVGYYPGIRDNYYGSPLDFKYQKNR